MAFLPLLVLVSTLSSSVVLASPFLLAPLVTPNNPKFHSLSNDHTATSHLIKDSYIIVLEDHLEDHHIDAHHAQVNHLHSTHNNKLRARSVNSNAYFNGLVHKYSIGKTDAREGKSAMKGYSGHFSEETIEAVRALRGVKLVERDSMVWTTEIERGAPWVRCRSRLYVPSGIRANSYILWHIAGIGSSFSSGSD